MIKKMETKNLIAYFKEEGFTIDYETIIIKKTSEETSQFTQEWYQRFKQNKYEALFYFGFQEKSNDFSPSINYLHYISSYFIDTLTKQSDIELTREQTNIPLQEEEIDLLLESLPFTIGMEHITSSWLLHIWDQLHHIFQEAISSYEGTIASFLTQYNANLHLVGRVFFHLVESKDELYPFAFLATYSTKSKSSKSKNNVAHVPLKNALLEYQDDRNKLLHLLSTISKAADKSNFISSLMESGELFSSIKLTTTEAYIFLSEIALYEEAGILCRVPNWWKKKSNSLRLSISIGEKQPSQVGMDAILSFNPSFILADDPITLEEVEQLLSQSEGLALIKGKWVEINHNQLQQVLDAYQKAELLSKDGELTLAEAMRLELNINNQLGLHNDDVDVQVKNGQWLSIIKDKLNHKDKVESHTLSTTFSANLRPYQQKGFDWLLSMYELGFGVCLADDMGLGKTVQIIAMLESIRVQKGGKILLIIPASLIGNWQKEIQRFAPLMNVKILHGKIQEIDFQSNTDNFLYITTYGMAVRLEQLKEINWDLIILDEAQAIKNHGTKQTKVIKQLKASSRIAMTGTPIENKLSDLWSLFDFLNAGLLGTPKEFTTFTKRLNDNNQDYARLRKIVNPFILRRLKTDRSIISDLPEKTEIKEYSTLTKKQIILYTTLVKEISTKLEEVEGIQRKGLVLSSIMKFKQICNHPDQFLGQEEFISKYSGKFERLKEICETIYEKRERVLIFTQFKEMTEPLSTFLETIFQKKGFVLHGGTPVKKRNEMVEQFNGEEYIPYMVLSIKAGGVGLNLTAANHVIHFDRWWNPAVENQATDRAFRIGQTKNVMVYKFVTTGTIEEKIDEMIESKEQLAGDILSSTGENWITELDNKELIELFSIGGDQ